MPTISTDEKNEIIYAFNGEDQVSFDHRVIHPFIGWGGKLLEQPKETDEERQERIKRTIEKKKIKQIQKEARKLVINGKVKPIYKYFKK